MSTPTDLVRFAHWIDIHELGHIGVDSGALWRELEVLECAEALLPRMPAVGDTVQVRYCGQVATVQVTWIYGDGSSFAAATDYTSQSVFTIADLIPAVQDDFGSVRSSPASPPWRPEEKKGR